MNGDWMEYEAANDELSQSGPLLSSYHCQSLQALTNMSAEHLDMY